ncbi:MAG: glycosyltransferase family 4 protein [Kiritimatiellae bacterium]|nr:glycosyltransferase family 4 protein [Kiritimatiellia bacterium]
MTAWTNLIQAQCLNARALVRYLDKEKLDVGAMVVYSGDLPVEDIPGVKYFKVRYPAKIWGLVQLVRGIVWSDVVYCQNPGHWRLVKWLVRLFRKKAFSTVEGMYIGTNIDKALATFGSKEAICEFATFSGNAYSITAAMRPVNEKAVGIKTKDKILYLGTDTEIFRNEVRRERLADIAMIGSNLFYKGLGDFLELARRFPELTFHVIGSGMGKISPSDEVAKRHLGNVICHGSLSHAELAKVLQNIQLHVFPSRAEGFPKVTLETAAAGVPSVVYDDYGADEWIETGKSGFVVKTLDEMAAVIQGLLDYPERLQPIADGAREMARRFDWRVLVRDWEREILSF